ncbi:MAG: hypothetical protein KAW16_07060 [candidate division Zixibacteria bacterium]|nr:hypothetical protein [candidate division Zixibacteria bacterium]
MKRRPFLFARSPWFIFVILAILIEGCGKCEDVYLRKFPYPYEAALAICSDLDHTDSIEKFLSIQEFLSSTEKTPFGTGLGLEVGNSFWFYNQYNQSLKKSSKDTTYIDSMLFGIPDRGISLFDGTSDTLSPYAWVMLKLIKAGYLDCLHSYGEFAEGGFSRDLTVKVVDFWKSEALSIDVYTNHGGTGNNDNIGPPSRFRGDNPSAVEYHTDLTVPLGIKFLWRGQVTHCIGQDGNFSLINFAKMVYEYFQDLFNREIDYTHDNSLVHIHTLDDGQKVFEFVRYINPLGKYPLAHQEYMQYQLGPKVIDELISCRGYLIFYTHLGTNKHQPYLCSPALDVLRYIKKKNDEAKLLVTTTSKLLNYYVHSKYLYWHHAVKMDSLFIMIDSISNEVEGSFVPSEKDLEGITFYVPEDKNVSLSVAGRPILFIENAKEESGKRSISVPWNKLIFPL